jgi:hypothetical protein
MATNDIASLLTERFGFSKDSSLGSEDSRYEIIRLNRPEFRLTALIFCLLKHIGCKPEPTFEKTAWMYSFTVAGSKCFVSSEKFGPKLYVPSNLTEKRKGSIQGMLIVGLQHYTNLLQSQIDRDLVGLNDFGIINQTSFLRRGYELFRAKTEESYALEKPLKTPVRLVSPLPRNLGGIRSVLRSLTSAILSIFTLGSMHFRESGTRSWNCSIS